MDFFGGSGTTAHAVMESNATDCASRRFILVQLDERPDVKADPSAAGFDTISALTRERLRRSAAKIRTSHPDVDLGFRALRVDTTNLLDTRRTPDETDQAQLDLSVDSVKPDRSGEDLLFQVLVDWGLELTLPISSEQIGGRQVFVVDDGALIACFEKQVSLDLVQALAKREPLRAVFLDAGFRSDDARINAEQIFREVSPSTDVKTV